MKKQYTETPSISINYPKVENVLTGSTDNVGNWKDEWFKEG